MAEAVAASAWHHPPYSYLRNYISDLGIPGCGEPGGGGLMCSPLAGVMNAGFVLAGLLCLAAAGLLAPLIRARAWRSLVVALACAHSAGSILVGLVHSAPGTAAGTPRLHVVGAYLAILGGNGMIALAGVSAHRAGAPRWFGLVSAGMGALALAGGAALVVVRGVPPGLFERLAVDLITIWEVAAGLLFGAALLRLRAHKAKVTLAGLSDGVPEPGS